ncbi:MAG: hypothetical protein ACLSGS_03005 [Adlercreutzia sp.]
MIEWSAQHGVVPVDDQRIGRAVRKPDSGSASNGHSNDSAQANSAPISSVVAHDLARRHQHPTTAQQFEHASGIHRSR